MLDFFLKSINYLFLWYSKPIWLSRITCFLASANHFLVWNVWAVDFNAPFYSFFKENLQLHFGCTLQFTRY